VTWCGGGGGLLRFWRCCGGGRWRCLGSRTAAPIGGGGDTFLVFSHDPPGLFSFLLLLSCFPPLSLIFSPFSLAFPLFLFFFFFFFSLSPLSVLSLSGLSPLSLQQLCWVLFIEQVSVAFAVAHGERVSRRLVGHLGATVEVRLPRLSGRRAAGGWPVSSVGGPMAWGFGLVASRRERLV